MSGENEIINLFTKEKFKTNTQIIQELIDEGKFKDHDFVLMMWKDTENPEREREYYTSGISFGTVNWEIDQFKQTIIGG